ncbi:uncharacterized protein EDB91DRAFT_1256032 [Suillus paluster]|uniref:uncharacterized protein n=1 Tax=Suillus paluster TaxID=48578 RepID=UPI001B86D3FE|nr:uncharacterized protein EDB91DRAFT_1256032 [Suillus paluster]KAG1722499.1 hypothetical protein EDB91DRAFT_1256032 [Suillus paluster]
MPMAPEATWPNVKVVLKGKTTQRASASARALRPLPEILFSGYRLYVLGTVLAQEAEGSGLGFSSCAVPLAKTSGLLRSGVEKTEDNGEGGKELGEYLIGAEKVEDNAEGRKEQGEYLMGVGK